MDQWWVVRRLEGSGGRYNLVICDSLQAETPEEAVELAVSRNEGSLFVEQQPAWFGRMINSVVLVENQ